MSVDVDKDHRDARTIYVAGASAEHGRIARYMQALRESGWIVTVDWPARVAAAKGADAELPFDEARRIATHDLAGVANAAVLWLVLPTAPSVGCWVELGYALGVRAPLIVTSGKSGSIFARLTSRHYESHVDALGAFCGGVGPARVSA